MKIERALKIQNFAAMQVNRIYESAVHFKNTSAEIHERVINVKKNFPKDTPRWVGSFIDGMVSVHNDLLFKNKLEYCYKVNGVLYSIRKKSDRYYEDKMTPKQLHDNAEATSGYYWIDTDKPYFVSSN